MTVLLAIVLYVIALLVVLILVGGVRRGDELHARSLRSTRDVGREPEDAPTPVRYAPPRSRRAKKAAQAAADAPGRSAIPG